MARVHWGHLGRWWRVTTGWGFVVVAPLQTVHGIGRESRRGSRESALLIPLLQQLLRQIPARKFVLRGSHTGRFGICCCCNHPCSIGAGCFVTSSQSSSVLCRPFNFLLSHLFPPLLSPAPSLFLFPFILKKNIWLVCLWENLEPRDQTDERLSRTVFFFSEENLSLLFLVSGGGGGGGGVIFAVCRWFFFRSWACFAQFCCCPLDKQIPFLSVSHRRSVLRRLEKKA